MEYLKVSYKLLWPPYDMLIFPGSWDRSPFHKRRPVTTLGRPEKCGSESEAGHKKCVSKLRGLNYPELVQLGRVQGTRSEELISIEVNLPSVLIKPEFDQNNSAIKIVTIRSGNKEIQKLPPSTLIITSAYASSRGLGRGLSPLSRGAS